MAWQSLNGFITLLCVTNTLAGVVALLLVALTATGMTWLGSKRCRDRCSRLAEAQPEEEGGTLSEIPPLRRKVVSATLGLGVALALSLLVFALASSPVSYDHTAYHARQTAAVDATRSLRVEAAWVGLFVGGLIRPGACDTHMHTVLYHDIENQSYAQCPESSCLCVCSCVVKPRIERGDQLLGRRWPNWPSGPFGRGAAETEARRAPRVAGCLPVLRALCPAGVAQPLLVRHESRRVGPAEDYGQVWNAHPHLTVIFRSASSSAAWGAGPRSRFWAL
jgi:hypothetical protein